MNIVITIGILFVLAAATHHLVAWAGSILHSVGSEEISYAVHTFRDERTLPMTTNILMNVCIPNVFMLFIFMSVAKLHLYFVEEFLIWYVVSFYFYRSFFICVILRRKELYSFPYELGTAAAGILLALFLKSFFLSTETTIFITASELREELWFAILVILFQFVRQILNKKVKQNTVLSDGQLTKYVAHKFDKFYKKYNDLLDITRRNRYMCIFLYSVMIFEDYNRVPLARKLERLKVRLGKTATVGIMQMESSLPLTDRESIIRFYSWLESCDNDPDFLAPYNSYNIQNLAWAHNHDDEYASCVAYIYNRLYEYIDKVPKYRTAFHLREEDGLLSPAEVNISNPYTIHSCDDIDSILQCTGNGSYIRLPENRLLIPDYAKLSPHPFAVPVPGGCTLILSNLENMYVRGTNTTISTAYANANVLTFRDCRHIILDHLKLGHSGEPDECQNAVLLFENCQNIIIRHLDLYCGTYGIIFSGGSIHIENCSIHDCSYGAITLSKANCIIDDSEIYDCKDIADALIHAEESNVVINHAILHDCSTPRLIAKDEASSIINHEVTAEHCEYNASLVNTEDMAGITVR